VGGGAAVKREKHLTPEQQAAEDAALLSRLSAPAVGRSLSILGQPWKGDIGGATAKALGLTVEELQRIESGELLPGETVPAAEPWYGRPVGDTAELSAALVVSMPGLAALVKDAIQKVSTWTKLADMPEILASLRLIDSDAADKMSACSNPDCGFIKFCPAGDYAQYCNRRCWLRICPNCARAIAARLRDKLAAVLVEVQRARAPGFGLKHLVLTMKRTLAEVEGLGPEAALMAQAMAAQRDIEDLHDMNKTLVRSLFIGDDKRAGASAYLEFGPQGGNVHSHNIAYSPYVPQDQISDKWRELSLSTRPIWRPWVEAQLAELQARKVRYKAELKALGKSRGLRARRLRLVIGRMTKAWFQAEIVRRAKRQGKGDCVVWVKRIDADKALSEVVKYVTKIHKVDAKTGAYETPVCDLVALHLALKGKRRAWSWGSFYGVDIVEPEPEFEAGTCPKCGSVLLGAPVAELRGLLLHSRNASNCQTETHPAPWSLPFPLGAGP
jgi:hypothetical protein